METDDIWSQKDFDEIDALVEKQKRKRESEQPQQNKKLHSNSLLKVTERILLPNGREITKTTFEFLEEGKNLAEGLTLYTNLLTPDELKEIEKLTLSLESDGKTTLK
jgi:hypothetical protein